MKSIFPSSGLPLTPGSFPRRCVLLGAALLGGLALGPARLPAQDSLSSGAQALVQQLENGGAYGDGGYSSQDGSPVSASYSDSYTGMDGAGNTQTLTYSGTASGNALYGQLHASAAVTVTNTYYNPNNPQYLVGGGGYYTINPAGSPDGFEAFGDANFTDTLQYGGALQSGYQARYIFHLDGTISGTNANAVLNVTIGNDPNQQFIANQAGTLSLDWATTGVPINGQNPQTIKVGFFTVVGFDLTDGSIPDGSNISSMANFADTLTLTGIEVVDANGNPVSGVTINSDSGTAYPMAVPEPGSWAAVLAGAGLLTLVLRRYGGAR